MAKAGRPRKRAEDRRGYRLVIKMTEAERELLEEVIRPESVSTWARGVLIKAAKRKRNA